MTLVFDFATIPVRKCRHCKKVKGFHKADSLECPMGMKTRIGYTRYGPLTFDTKMNRDLKNAICDELEIRPSNRKKIPDESLVASFEELYRGEVSVDSDLEIATYLRALNWKESLIQDFLYELKKMYGG